MLLEAPSQGVDCGRALCHELAELGIQSRAGDTVLRAEVVAHLDDIDRVADRVEEPVEVAQVQLGESLEEPVSIAGTLGQVEQELAEAPEELRPLHQIPAEGAQDCLAG